MEKLGTLQKSAAQVKKNKVREVVIPKPTVLFLKCSVQVERKIMCTIELGTSPFHSVVYSRQIIPVLGQLDTYAHHDGCSALASF